MIVADSQCAADPAVNAANKVIDQDRRQVLVGEVCSSASIPMSEIAEARRIVQISPTSTNAARDPQRGWLHQTVHLPRLLHRSLPGYGDGQVRHEQGLQDRLRHVRSGQ